MMRMLMAIEGAFALAMAAQTAAAADIPTTAPAYKAPVAAPLFNWSGFYAGVQGGYAWGKTEHAALSDRTGDFDLDGWHGGGTIGWNWQHANWVLGFEADFSWSNIDGSVDQPPNMDCGVGCRTEVEWFGTARARFGPSFDRLLLYVTGGFAYGRVHAGIGAGFFGAESSVTTTGWTAGIGGEYAFAPNWSAKVEYLYVDLGSFTYGQVGLSPTDIRASADFHLVRAGINYRFATGKAPGPVMTKY